MWADEFAELEAERWRRAEAVRDWCVEHGMPSHLLWDLECELGLAPESPREVWDGEPW
jgi:hypothetical protein